MIQDSYVPASVEKKTQRIAAEKKENSDNILPKLKSSYNQNFDE